MVNRQAMTSDRETICIRPDGPQSLDRLGLAVTQRRRLRTVMRQARKAWGSREVAFPGSFPSASPELKEQVVSALEEGITYLLRHPRSGPQDRPSS